MITLSPNGSNQSRPLEFYLKDDVYIYSYIESNCNSLPQISTKWTVKKCDVNCSILVQLNSSIATTLSELFIPSFSLPLGTYELMLTVLMTTSTFSVNSTVSVYIRINKANVIVNLMYHDTSMISQSDYVDLILDPGYFSIDPNSMTFNMNVSYIGLIARLLFLLIHLL